MTAELLSTLDDVALAGVLARLPVETLDALLGPVVAARASCDPRLVAVVEARLQELPAASRERLLAKDSPWRASLFGRWLLALNWSAMPEKLVLASVLWTELIEQSAAQMSRAYYERARVRRALKDLDGCVADLAACARHTLDFGLLSQAARLLDRVLDRGTAVPGRKVRVGLVSSSTLELVPPLLRLLGARDGLAIEVYTAPYGMYRAELANRDSGLHAFKPDFIVVALHWRDAALRPLGNGAGAAERIIEELKALWDAAQQVSPCTILQHAFDFPSEESAGFLSVHEEGGRGRVLADVNLRLFRARVPGVMIVDCPRLAAQAGAAVWDDGVLWHVAKQHPAATALPLLMDRYVRLMAARLGLAKKVLVLDLDHTLWAGGVGDDGPHGLQVGPPSAVGEAHAALQRYAVELKQRGVLLAVCSKNNEADAREPFRSTLGMVLKEDDFAAFYANWDEKPVNLRRIAQQLNVGTDSLVFVDDNPLERAKVRRELPEVTVVDLPADPAGFVAALDRGAYFESLSLSQEDTARHDAYAANARRESLKSQADDTQDFLRRLDMRMHHSAFGDATQDRVVQLLNKTNQFNVTTRRHGAADLARLRADPAVWTHYFRLVDCFGDNGLIGVVIARPAETEKVWEIDTLLMSCRVLGRGAEEFMVATLLGAARERGIARVRARYLPSAKNGRVADLFPRLGFTEETRAPDGSATYLWDLAAQGVPKVDFVRSAGP